MRLRPNFSFLEICKEIRIPLNSEQQKLHVIIIIIALLFVFWYLIGFSGPWRACVYAVWTLVLLCTVAGCHVRVRREMAVDKYDVDALLPINE